METDLSSEEFAGEIQREGIFTLEPFLLIANPFLEIFRHEGSSRIDRTQQVCERSEEN